MTPIRKSPSPKSPASKPVTFSFTHPTASSVAVAGSFNDWSATKHPLKRGKNGTWSKSIRLKPGRYEYKFVVNGSEWVDDSNATEHSPNDQGGMNCVRTVQ